MNCKQESYFPNGMYLMPHLKWLNGKFYAMWFHPNKKKQAAELFSIEWAVESPLSASSLLTYTAGGMSDVSLKRRK